MTTKWVFVLLGALLIFGWAAESQGWDLRWLGWFFAAWVVSQFADLLAEGIRHQKRMIELLEEANDKLDSLNSRDK